MPIIVHLGVGNFHRAHQAAYTAAANAAEHQSDPWRIVGVSLRRPDMRDALRGQAWRYALVERDEAGSSWRWIDALERILVGREDPEAVLAAIADPKTEICTLTVTEKGYCLASDGALDFDDPQIAAELADGLPRTAIGFLAHGLARRAAAGLGPLTVLSCDNLSGNGDTLRRAVAAFAAKAGLELDLADAFPNAMVDRIVPATTDALRAEVLGLAGVADAWPVETEKFSEWVIEDRFAGPRPAWDKVGVRLVDAVEPWEQRKLRMLNGAHSFLAYAGLAKGCEFVHEAAADPELAEAARALMAEAATTLPEEAARDAEAYADELMRRFLNPNLRHRLRQIAMDGSTKLPVRLLPTIEARLDGGREAPRATAAVRSWLDFVIANETLDDPLADELRAIVDAGGENTRVRLLRAIGADPSRIAI